MPQKRPTFGIPYADPEAIPSDIDGMSTDDLVKLWAWKNNYKELQKTDPITYGFTLPGWEDVLDDWNDYDVMVIFGGNRSSKSTFAARTGLHFMDKIPECKARCWSANQDSSIRDQQSMVHHEMPRRYKEMPKQKGKDFSVQWSQKNGFSGDVLILPPKPGVDRGSEMVFQTYKGWANDTQISEGWNAHYIWCDEEVPLKLLETLMMRILDHRNNPVFRPKIIVTFTTMKGLTALMHKLTNGAETVKKRYARLLDNPEYKGIQNRYPGFMVPYRQIPKGMNAKIFYFWTEDNPFMPKESVESFKKRSLNQVLQKAYGICDAVKGTPFPKFDKRIHVVKHGDIPFIKGRKSGVTHYQTIDPAGRKNWFMLYAGIVESLDAEMPFVYIWQEWPDTSYGDWGLPSEKAEGKHGPAMAGLGLGLKGYRDMMARMESGVEIFERGIDKRFANTTRQGDHGDTKLMDDLNRVGLRFVTPYKKKIAGIQNEIDIGIQLINDYLDYNEKEEIDSTNRPHLYISDRCENLIRSMEYYTASGGDKEVWKDPIDCLRILLELEPKVVNYNQVKGPSRYGGY